MGQRGQVQQALARTCGRAASDPWRDRFPTRPGPGVRAQGEAKQALLLADRLVRTMDEEPDSAAVAAMFRLRRGAALFGAPCAPCLHSCLQMQSWICGGLGLLSAHPPESSCSSRSLLSTRTRLGGQCSWRLVLQSGCSKLAMLATAPARDLGLHAR